MRKYLAWGICAALLASCGNETAPDYEPRVEEHERQLGAEQHQAILAEFGGPYRGPETVEVDRVGARVAEAAGLADQCRFTILNAAAVNAFAVPGCYIYITRGLVGVVEEEAQLASVLAHEVGHIVADHVERRQRGSLASDLAVTAVGVITESEQLTQIAGAAANLVVLRYSRGQEYEADDLAIRYLSQAGYEPGAAAEMLETLLQHEQTGQEIGLMPEWVRTHPLTENRIGRARREAERLQGPPPASPLPPSSQ